MYLICEFKIVLPKIVFVRILFYEYSIVIIFLNLATIFWHRHVSD